MPTRRSFLRRSAAAAAAVAVGVTVAPKPAARRAAAVQTEIPNGTIPREPYHDLLRRTIGGVDEAAIEESWAPAPARYAVASGFLTPNAETEAKLRELLDLPRSSERRYVAVPSGVRFEIFDGANGRSES